MHSTKNKTPRLAGLSVAESEGFEPPVTGYATMVFKTTAFNRSANSP